MRAIQLALLIMAIQFGLGFVQTFGGFGSMPYESKIMHVNVTPTGKVIQTEEEQKSFSWGVFGNIMKILTWDWIKDLAQPWYSQDQGVKSLIDFITKGLASLCGIIYGAAIIEFIANRVNVLR